MSHPGVRSSSVPQIRRCLHQSHQSSQRHCSPPQFESKASSACYDLHLTVDKQECNSTECRIPLSFMSQEHLVLEVNRIELLARGVNPSSKSINATSVFRAGSTAGERRVWIWSRRSDKLLPVQHSGQDWISSSVLLIFIFRWQPSQSVNPEALSTWLFCC